MVFIGVYSPLGCVTHMMCGTIPTCELVNCLIQFSCTFLSVLNEIIKGVVLSKKTKKSGSLRSAKGKRYE